jgi:hypothetical protein
VEPKLNSDFGAAGAAGVEAWAVVPKVNPDLGAVVCCASATLDVGADVWGPPKLGNGFDIEVVRGVAEDPAKRPANGFGADGVLDSPVGGAVFAGEASVCSGGVLEELPNKGAAAFVSSFCVALKPVN